MNRWHLLRTGVRRKWKRQPTETIIMNRWHLLRTGVTHAALNNFTMHDIFCLPTLTLILLGLVGCGQNTSTNKPEVKPPMQQPAAEEAYLARRTKWKTALIQQGPSPQKWRDDPLPDGVTSITYESDSRKLKAWLFRPKLAKKERRPALVYLHGGFAFGADDYEDCQPFSDAGFVVLCPTFRGENGNPGDFEMMYGEVDDAAAAVRWLASQQFVDPSKVFVFGHSSGGIMAAILSLYDDLPLRHTGSAGGLYGTDVFDLVPKTVPFDMRDRQETELRVLIGNVRWMKRPHFAFVGNADSPMKSEIGRREAKEANAPLTIVELQGDHHSSLAPAVRRYLDICRSEK
jgi:acetyl esterase/lipase